MKRLVSFILVLVLITGFVQAKEYKVIVDDKIVPYFEKALDPNFELRIRYSVRPDDCPVCESKKHLGMLCRQHTSIHRVIEANNVLKDLDTDTAVLSSDKFLPLTDNNNLLSLEGSSLK